MPVEGTSFLRVKTGKNEIFYQYLVVFSIKIADIDNCTEKKTLQGAIYHI